jgi:hypothetical protein
MNVTVSLFADDLAHLTVTGSRALDDGRRQVRLGERFDACSYITADEAQQIAEAWTTIAVQLHAQVEVAA